MGAKDEATELAEQNKPADEHDDTESERVSRN